MAFLLRSAAALGGTSCPDGSPDGDGVDDAVDNCVSRYNGNQDDTDAEDCGNLCDADYDNDGTVAFGDFGALTVNFGTANQLYNHTEPVTDTVGFGDFGFFVSSFGGVPGPSGTTIGTIACP